MKLAHVFLFRKWGTAFNNRSSTPRRTQEESPYNEAFWVRVGHAIQLSFKWKVPITYLGAMEVAKYSSTVDEVRMLVAGLIWYWKCQPIPDEKAMSRTFVEACIGDTTFDFPRLWEMQKIEERGIRPCYNLLDMLTHQEIHANLRD